MSVFALPLDEFDEIDILASVFIYKDIAISMNSSQSMLPSLFLSNFKKQFAIFASSASIYPVSFMTYLNSELSIDPLLSLS